MSDVSHDRRSWTWTEMVGTYRFWGLVLFYALCFAVTEFLYGAMMPPLLTAQLSFQQVGQMAGVRTVAFLVGLYLAWVAARGRSKAVLLSAAVLKLVGFALALAPWSGERLLALRYVGEIGIGLGSGAIALAVPATIAGGRGGSEGFVVAFGFATVVARVSSTLGGPAILATRGGLWQPLELAAVLALCTVLGAGALLPVRRAMFAEAPPEGKPGTPPVRRRPIVVALLCLIPLYGLYWVYRVHAETTFIASDRRPVAPAAALWIALLVPFALPILLANVADVLSQAVVTEDAHATPPAWTILLLSVLLPPIAAALVQARLNAQAQQ